MLPGNKLLVRDTCCLYIGNIITIYLCHGRLVSCFIQQQTGNKLATILLPIYKQHVDGNMLPMSPGVNASLGLAIVKSNKNGNRKWKYLFLSQTQMSNVLLCYSCSTCPPVTKVKRCLLIFSQLPQMQKNDVVGRSVPSAIDCIKQIMQMKRRLSRDCCSKRRRLLTSNMRRTAKYCIGDKPPPVCR